MSAEKTVLITGGAGFLGKRICHFLKEKHYQVISLSRKKYPELEAQGIESRICDLRHPEEVKKQVWGASHLIHTAAKAGIWGDPQEFYETNTLGTKNLLQAAQANGIKHFLYTSSPSVCFDGSDILGEGEERPYAKKHLCAYSESKQKAEEMVLKAGKNTSLKTSSLRPHLIWGPDDPHFLPRLREKASKGQLFQLGSGENLVDVIYVDNAARAHVDLLEKLLHSETPKGEAYFIGQEKPVKLWDFLNQLLWTLGLPPVQRKLPLKLAYSLGAFSEKLYGMLRIYRKEPKLTRFLALQLATSHYFSHKKAKKDFDYQVYVSLEEGLHRLKTSI